MHGLLSVYNSYIFCPFLPSEPSLPLQSPASSEPSLSFRAKPADPCGSAARFARQMFTTEVSHTLMQAWCLLIQVPDFAHARKKPFADILYQQRASITRYHLCSWHMPPQRLLSKSYPITGINRELLLLLQNSCSEATFRIPSLKPPRSTIRGSL